MKRILVFLLLINGNLLVVHGQKSETLELSLQKAMDMGVQHRLDLKNQQLQTQIAKNEIRKLESKNLPQITGTADLRYYTTLQTNILPGSTFGTPGAPDKAVKFGLPYNNNIGFNLKQNIYDPSTNYDRKISLVSSESEKLNLEQSTVDVKLAIADAYYSVLLNQERFKLSKANYVRNQAYFVSAKQKFDNNNLIRTDLDRFSLDFQNAKVSLQKDSSNHELSKLNLVNQLGMPIGTSIVLTDNLESASTGTTINAQTSDGTNRVEVRREQLNVKVNELNVKKQNNSYLPSVQFYANQTFQQLSRDFKFFDGTTWYPYNYLGLQVNVPIFDGLLKSRTRDEFLLKKQISANNIEKLKLDINYELQSSYVALENAGNNMEYARNNYTQAKDLVGVYETRFKQGTSVYADVLNTEYSLQTAQNNLMSAYYDYLVAKLKWLKAKGEL